MKKIYLLFILYSISFSSWSHPIPADTLDQARQFIGQKQLTEANALLTAYNKNSSSSFGLQLQAQVYYWLEEFEKAEETYERAINKFPLAKEVILDYGRLLFELGKYRKATHLLKELEKTYENVEIDILLAKILFLNSRIGSAEAKADAILKVYPTNQEALKLKSAVAQATPVTVELGSSYSADDQPIRALTFEGAGSWYKSFLLAPSLKIKKSNFVLSGLSSTTTLIKAENTLTLGYGKTVLKAGGGLFQSTVGSKVIGSFYLSQKVTNSLSVTSSLERLPYQFTRASIKEPILQDVFSAGLYFNSHKKWLGSLNFIEQSFEEGDRISTAYAWLLAPLIHQPSFYFYAGVSSSYATSNANTFTSRSPASTVAETYTLYAQVPGIYAPYFTPNKQLVHSILTTAKIQISKKVIFSSKASVGVFAKTDNPILLLEQNEEQYYYINKYYSPQNYRPVELEGSLRFLLNKKISLIAQHQFKSLFFYKSNIGSIQFRYLFNNE